MINPTINHFVALLSLSNAMHLLHVQCNAFVAITGAIRGTSQTKLYDELGFKSLKCRLWFRHLCTFYKIQSSTSSDYLFKLILKITNPYNTRTNVCRAVWCRTKAFKN